MTPARRPAPRRRLILGGVVGVVVLGVVFVLLQSRRPANADGGAGAPGPREVSPTPAPAATAPAGEVVVSRAPARFRGAAQARVEPSSALVVYQDGRRGIFTLAALAPDELAWIKGFAAQHPLAVGKGSVTVSREEATQTIVRQAREGTTEILQLRPPNIPRDQIGGTCVLYSTAHLMDIAGYGVTLGEIYRVIANSPPANPWLDDGYAPRLTEFEQRVGGPKAAFHPPPNAATKAESFAWARQQLRRGRPIQAVLREQFWLTFPAEYMAKILHRSFDAAYWRHGHAVVINGFTEDAADPAKTTFHVINSWNELPEFDVKVDAATAPVLEVVRSLSPKGAPPEVAEIVTVTKITARSAVGKQFLFDAETNQGPRQVIAPDAEKARALIEGR